MLHSNHLDWPSAPPTLEWSTTDESTTGKVEFLTKIDVTGEDIGAVSPAAFHRMVCFYVLTRLSEKSLVEACQSLIGIYSWQLNLPNVTIKNPEIRHLGPVVVRQKEKAPFIIRGE